MRANSNILSFDNGPENMRNSLTLRPGKFSTNSLKMRRQGTQHTLSQTGKVRTESLKHYLWFQRSRLTRTYGTKSHIIILRTTKRTIVLFLATMIQISLMKKMLNLPRKSRLMQFEQTSRFLFQPELALDSYSSEC